jgi:hypothetical protein
LLNVGEVVGEYARNPSELNVCMILHESFST